MYLSFTWHLNFLYPLVFSFKSTLAMFSHVWFHPTFPPLTPSQIPIHQAIDPVFTIYTALDSASFISVILLGPFPLTCRSKTFLTRGLLYCSNTNDSIGLRKTTRLHISYFILGVSMGLFISYISITKLNARVHVLGLFQILSKVGWCNLWLRLRVASVGIRRSYILAWRIVFSIICIISVIVWRWSRCSKNSIWWYHDPDSMPEET